jgi:Prokaryotic phospholipase A2
VRAGAAQSGQASPEYVGLIFLVALVAMAFTAIKVEPGIASAVQGAFCNAVGAKCAPALTAAESLAQQEAILEGVFDGTLDEFLAMKGDPEHDPRMDYSDDGCSAPTGSEGFWFHFREACERHDFGYRNAKRLGLFDDLKDRIDLAFVDDMVAACAEEAWWQRRPCRWMAGVYFGAVSIAGGHCEVPGDLIGRLPGPCAPPHG